MRKIRVPLSEQGITNLLHEINTYEQWQIRRGRVLLDRLAQMGAAGASLRFSRAFYQGMNDVVVTANRTANGYVIMADGEAALFIEFGSGITYGAGHPEAGEHGMGPGTYPSEKEHWNDTEGWWIPRDKQGGHTYGNPPAMAMYQTIRELERELPNLVKEVFSS